jgi:hypothetical protein
MSRLLRDGQNDIPAKSGEDTPEGTSTHTSCGLTNRWIVASGGRPIAAVRSQLRCRSRRDGRSPATRSSYEEVPCENPFAW